MFDLGIETETLEFKRTTSETKEAVNSICAILNKHGKGELYFGVAPSGIISGQTVTEQTLRDLGTAISNGITPKIYPAILKVNIDDKDCILVKFNGSEQPYFAHGKAKIRVADSDLDMSPAEIEKYILNKASFSGKWEAQISNFTTAAVDEKTLRRYIAKAKEKKRIAFDYTNKDSVLNKLFLTSEQKLLNAGKVLFCESELTELQMAIFATRERMTFNDIQRLHGDVFTLIDAAELYVRNNIRWKVEFDGSLERKEIPEIPIKAVREAIVNSFCHKDYSMMEANEIVIFPDRVEVYNPGRFPEGYTPEDFILGNERPIRRNPLIAQIMYYSQDAENFGTGLKRIKDICDEAKVKVDFKSTKAGFVSIFHRPENFEETPVVGKNTESGGQSSRVSSGESGRESGVESGGQSGSQSSGQSGGQSHSIDTAILNLCEKEPCSVAELLEKLVCTTRSSYIRGRISHLRKLGLLEYTIPEKPNSRLQKYRLVKK